MHYGLCEVAYITFVPIVVVSDILESRTDKCYSLSSLQEKTTLVMMMMMIGVLGRVDCKDHFAPITTE